jgi:hypothetical protein
MTIELSDQQREALGRPTPGPVYVLDPVSHARYVLLPDEAYERFRALFEETPFDVAEAYPLIDEVGRKEGWDDPAMDAYDRLDPRREQ